MKNILLALLLVLLISGTASALVFDATLTADNHYSLYYGNESEGINFVGRNEMGSGGNPGTYNWSQAENYSFDINAGDYIYVVGWSDDSVAQGWIGEFVSDNETILSNSLDWEYLLGDTNLGDNSPAPTVGELASTIAGQEWSSGPSSIDHGAGPWGTIADISTEADWIWGTALYPGSGAGEFQVFRTMVAPAPVPEPATMFLLGTGLVGLAGIRRRKK